MTEPKKGLDPFGRPASGDGIGIVGGSIDAVDEKQMAARVMVRDAEEQLEEEGFEDGEDLVPEEE